MSDATFKSFVYSLREGKVGQAGKTLEALMGLNEMQAFRSARFFQKKMEEDPEGTLTTAMKIREDLEGDSYNTTILALSELFGLNNVEAVVVAGRLKTELDSGKDE